MARALDGCILLSSFVLHEWNGWIFVVVSWIYVHCTNAGGSPIICVVGVGYRSLDVFSHLPIVLHEWNGCIFVVVSILDIYRKLYGLCGFQIWQKWFVSCYYCWIPHHFGSRSWLEH